MIQSIYQNGLRAENMDPLSGTLGASVYSLLHITFNSELNTASIVGNIAVFEDVEGKYVNMDSIRANPSGFPKVDGNYTYKDRVVTFTPSSPLKNSVKYIVAIREGGIKDIYGNAFVGEQAFHFVTESDDVEAKVTILSPKHGVVAEDVPDISWTNAGSSAYHIEISSQQTFETTAFVDTVKSVSGAPARTEYSVGQSLQDGMYYIRVRALKGLWSEPVQIYIKKITGAITTSEDLSDIIDQLEIGEQPLELLEVYPRIEESGLPLSMALCYYRFDGFIPFEELDIYNSTMERVSLDGSTEIPEDVPGEWIHVYSTKEDATYIIYRIEK